MKIVFMGTPDFAVPSLETLINKFDVKAVFTQPDRPKGRGKKLSMSAVKECALKYELPIYQPIRLKNDEECINIIKSIEPDFIVVVAFGQLLTKEILDIPKYGCINLHGSLLPKYRGAAPINFSIMNGEKVSGNTTMLMDIGLDTGDMLLKDEVEIKEDMTAGELYDELMSRGGDLLVRTLEGLYNGTIKPIAQNDDESTYASKLDKTMAKIDWTKSSLDIHNQIRGMNPFPVAYTTYKDKMMKIYKSVVVSNNSLKEAGTILKADKSGILVKTGSDALLIEEVQFPNGKPMKVKDYMNGNTIEEGIILE
ncbi:MAG: methionyl-tRNA formyltransferase [Clostridium cadaveris]|uniref:Methionyl-tRNA formyltransferase n=1 Tax=Clostridium cadaveris TaxID=1529 RepID=A0A1I2JFM7_9CLOT|nr:methionyl-tRNA formyltransferase [Clostridium cadaveris]MDM8311109.1 methionyl-tRNA formyltransferase [Clostridium cadaveris]MDY4947889.1 methionyl-tRNA formyltransferase [Clostridium cadaveris]NWK11704.1 methionyl-tRNA formyltransferase [Clostridium cadaveris]PWL53481.1 MAG: methionyl-tRNA formyltransferase [Clostridium cadaveris]UFH66379.1 methionyl-tRNA formyltransferase [Clostridium cadaveris]